MSSAGIINFIYNETIVSRTLPSSSVDYNWFTGINVWEKNPCVDSCESIVIDWWREQSPRNYSLFINKIYNSSRRHTLLLSPSRQKNKFVISSILEDIFLEGSEQQLAYYPCKTGYTVSESIKYSKKNH